MRLSRHRLGECQLRVWVADLASGDMVVENAPSSARAKIRISGMAEELAFKDEAAAEYDRAFAHVTAHFMPFLLRAAHVAPGMRVLDIATGTGLSAEAALAVVGRTGNVTAADLSPAMAEKARERLNKAPNVLVSVEDGQALSFPDRSFDAAISG
jgi:protein-L-isoaspartate O-methyltransferase